MPKPRRNDLPAPDVQLFRRSLEQFLSTTDEYGRKWADARWGAYAFYDFDGEPIYVGQTNEQLRVRVRRHLTNQRTDAVAMRILDVFEVAEVELWPLWDFEGIRRAAEADVQNSARRHLNAVEYAAYVQAITGSRFRAILNEKIPPVSKPVTLPPSIRGRVIDPSVADRLGHPDVRIARRADTLSRLAAVAHERGEVSVGLRRVLVIQAVRLAWLSAVRLADAEGREPPHPATLRTDYLIGSVFEDPDGDGDVVLPPS